DYLPKVAFEHVGLWVKGFSGRVPTRPGRRRGGPASFRRAGRLSGLLLLGAGLLRDRLDEALADLDLRVVGHANDEAVLLDVRDRAVDPAGRDDLIAGLERAEHPLVLLLLLLLRGDEEEIESTDEEQPHDYHRRREARAGGRGGCLGYHFSHCVLRSSKEKTRI